METSTVIWRFDTVEGSVRLMIGAPEERLSDLHGELVGCAIVADSFREFIELASRAVQNSEGILGEIMKQPWAEGQDSLFARLRRAAHLSDPLTAATTVVEAASVASAFEVDRLFGDSRNTLLLQYIRDLAVSLDEAGDPFVQDLAAAFCLPVEQLSSVLSELP